MRSRRGLAAALRQLGADQEARHHLDVALAIAVQIGSPLLPALERERAELGGSPFSLPSIWDRSPDEVDAVRGR